MTPEQECRELFCGGPDTHCESPTGRVVRKQDAKGAGHFGAPRRNKDGTPRKHGGIDTVAEPGQDVRATTGGIVKRWGYADKIKYGLRLVEVETTNGKYLQRFLYADPIAAEGTDVKAGQVIGRAQSLQSRHEGITDHVHFDVLKPNFAKPWKPEDFIDPTPLFSPLLFGK